jgi:hypothetical protein
MSDPEISQWGRGSDEGVEEGFAESPSNEAGLASMVRDPLLKSSSARERAARFRWEITRRLQFKARSCSWSLSSSSCKCCTSSMLLVTKKY